MFEITPADQETILHQFGSQGDGQNPSGDLIAYKGDFYGVTQYGGANGYGTVFKISAKGVETVLYSFTNGADGAYPSGALLEVNGALYGAASGQGQTAMANGSIFELTSTLKTIYTFQGGTDGADPNGDLLEMGGNLYGLTRFGGGSTACGNGGCGTAFRLSPKGKETVLHVFTSTPDGGLPGGGLAKVKNVLYGVTYNGGTGFAPIGTVFALRP